MKYLYILLVVSLGLVVLSEFFNEPVLLITMVFFSLFYAMFVSYIAASRDVRKEKVLFGSAEKKWVAMISLNFFFMILCGCIWSILSPSIGSLMYNAFTILIISSISSLLVLFMGTIAFTKKRVGERYEKVIEILSLEIGTEGATIADNEQFFVTLGLLIGMASIPISILSAFALGVYNPTTIITFLIGCLSVGFSLKRYYKHADTFRKMRAASLQIISEKDFRWDPLIFIALIVVFIFSIIITIMNHYHQGKWYGSTICFPTFFGIGLFLIILSATVGLGVIWKINYKQRFDNLLKFLFPYILLTFMLALYGIL